MKPVDSDRNGTGDALQTTRSPESKAHSQSQVERCILKLWSKLVFWISLSGSGSVARLFAKPRLLKNEDESKRDAAKIFESSIIIGEFASVRQAHCPSAFKPCVCTLCTMNSNPRSFPRVIKVIQKDTSTGTATSLQNNQKDARPQSMQVAISIQRDIHGITNIILRRLQRDIRERSLFLHRWRRGHLDARRRDQRLRSEAILS